MDKTTAAYEIKSLFRGQPLAYLVGFYVFAFYMELWFRIPELQAIKFQFIYGGFIGLLCLFKLVNERTKAPLNSVTKTAFLLIFILGIYTVFSMDRPTSIRIYDNRVIKFALVSFFIYAATDKIEDLRVIIAFMLLAWLKIGQEGFYGWYTGNLVWENQGIPRLHGSTAMYGHPNSFSGFAVGTLAYSMFLLMGLKSYLLRIGILALIVCCLIIIVTTGSRTGYLATIIGGIYFFLKLKAGKIKILFLLTITIILTINLVPNEYKGRFESIFTGEEKEGRSSEARLQILKDATEVYLHYPLGIGVQAFPKVREEMFGRSQDTHNLYFEILTNIGPVGLIVFCIFIWQMISLNIYNITQTERKTLDGKLLINLSQATIGFILVRLLLGMFGMDLYEIYWWMALGLTLAINKLVRKSIHIREHVKT